MKIYRLYDPPYPTLQALFLAWEKLYDYHIRYVTTLPAVQLPYQLYRLPYQIVWLPYQLYNYPTSCMTTLPAV